MSQQWSVAQVFSNRSHRIRRDVEALGYGTFQPTYAKVWLSDGKRSAKERPLLPGYVLFQTEPDGWGAVGSTEGVIRVLAADGLAHRVGDREMHQLMLDHATGRWNEIEGLSGEKPRGGRRVRRPRPSRRAKRRKAMRAR